MSDNAREAGYQVIVRLPPEMYETLERLTATYTKRSVLAVRVGKATVAREAIALGLPLLEAKFKEGDDNDV